MPDSKSGSPSATLRPGIALDAGLEMRCGGSGYPRGLRADEILKGAKVLAVSDVVEAMISHRPYRPALGIERALAEIEGGAGEIFDAEVVHACGALFREGHVEFSA